MVTEPRHLHGYRAVSQDRGAPGFGETVVIDQQIARVTVDVPRRLIIAERGQILIAVEGAGDRTRNRACVGAPAAITKGLDAAAIVSGDDRLHQERRRVRAELRAQITDAKPPTRTPRGPHPQRRRDALRDALPDARRKGSAPLRIDRQDKTALYQCLLFTLALQKSRLHGRG